MSVKLTTNLSQRLVLTPQLRQRIEMLQMTSVELSELIQQQMLENPVLEEVDRQYETRELEEGILDHTANSISGDTGTEAADYSALTAAPSNDLNGASEVSIADHTEVADFSEATSGAMTTAETSDDVDTDDRPHDSFEEVDFGREFQEYLDPGYRTQEIEYNPDAPTFEQFLTRPPSLCEHLTWQLHMDPCDETLYEVAESVIGNLDSDGRLNATNAEIAAFGGWSEELVEQARQKVMRLEPVGCGTRDVRECLLVQLEDRGCEDELAITLIKDHMVELQPHKIPNLAKALNVSLERIGSVLELVRTLDPYPGRRYASDEPILITPEIFIEKIDEDYVIYFNDDGSPRLRINQTYQQMLERPNTSKEERDFIKDKMRSAVDLLRNVEHRRQTIYKVVEAIVQRQSEFLDKGVEYIKPMMLKDIAEDIGMHLSTISRVVNRKYAHTPQGVIELRRFFTEGMTNEDGEEVSTRIIKLKIKKLIEDEDSRNPITDDQVVKILSKEGIKLSRRTVAKYRDQMRIPGSRERRAVV
jgi:RNA polymerase sigma-54 factor